LAEISILAESIAGVLVATKNKNRAEFLAWMNNRLVGLTINLQLLQSKRADEETL
jgi:hypothetical protein